MFRRSLSLLAALIAAALATTPAIATEVRVVNGRFLVTTPDGRTLGSEQLVGRELVTPDGFRFRIDAVAPAAERPQVLLHQLSMRGADGTWETACEADATGRTAGFPVAGRLTESGRFEADAASWFLTCTSGSQGKCILWGFDPWGEARDGRAAARFYEACQHMVRADYDGSGAAHTRPGTPIDIADATEVGHTATADDPSFAFEAGWGPDGAVCVARTRLPDLLTRDALVAATPRLGGACDEAEARRRGAILFTRVVAR